MKTKQAHKTVLILSGDDAVKTEISSSLQPDNYIIFKARTHSEALALYKKHAADIAIIDIENMPAQEMDLVNYIKTHSPTAEIIILTTKNELENATQSLHYGASFYLMKPVNYPDLNYMIDKLSAKISRSNELIEFEQRLLNDLMAGNPLMQKLLKLAMKIAPTNSTVLIGGESGSGKEFFAKIIHRMSQRPEGKFVAMNCGAIPDTLFESELFGYKKGAFTGADRDKPGLVEEAHIGTLFLDEVGELSQSAQVKLLRFLQEHAFRRVGDPALRTVDVRVLAATNKDLQKKIETGEFREDLYYRLNVFYMHLPPLRDRKETIPNLIRLFVHKNNTMLGKNINKISKGAEVILAEYGYPGNVRELENIIEHAMVLADSSEITENDLPEFMFRNRLRLTAPDDKTTVSPAHTAINIPTLAEVEKHHIQSALAMLDNNYTETAKKLGISRSTLWRKLKTHHLAKD